MNSHTVITSYIFCLTFVLQNCAKTYLDPRLRLCRGTGCGVPFYFGHEHHCGGVERSLTSRSFGEGQSACYWRPSWCFRSQYVVLYSRIKAHTHTRECIRAYIHTRTRARIYIFRSLEIGPAILRLQNRFSKHQNMAATGQKNLWSHEPMTNNMLSSDGEMTRFLGHRLYKSHARKYDICHTKTTWKIVSHKYSRMQHAVISISGNTLIELQVFV